MLEANSKIGMYIALRLLRDGAHTTITTRFPRDAVRRFSALPDAADWIDRLRIVGIDQGIQHRADRLERDGRGAVLFLGVCGRRADSEGQENGKSRQPGNRHGESSVIAATRGARSLATSGPIRSPCAQP